MKRSIPILFFSLFIFVGCTSIRDALRNPFSMDSPVINQFVSKANEYEKKGDLKIALQYWEVIDRLTPDKEISTKEIHRLKKDISQKANYHLKQGITLLKQNKNSGAEKEFLTVLRIKPEETSPLDLLTLEINKDDAISYTVKSGDTFKQIAQKLYKDPEIAFLIRDFSPKTSSGLPVPGTILTLPFLEKQYSSTYKEKSDKEAVCLLEQKIEEDLVLAKKYFNAKNYEKVIAITECILENDSENKEAYNLTLDSYYQLGKKFRQQKDYLPALEMFHKLAPEYKDVKQLLADLDKSMKEQSEVHYRQGLKYFINEDLHKAIAEWEKSLDLNPANNKVEKDIKDARDLLEKLKKIE